MHTDDYLTFEQLLEKDNSLSASEDSTEISNLMCQVKNKLFPKTCDIRNATVRNFSMSKKLTYNMLK